MRGRAAALVPCLAALLLTSCGAEKPVAKPFEFSAEFSRSLPPDLTEGSPARVAGIQVGTVAAVQRSEGGGVVTVRLESKFGPTPIRADASAKVRARIFLEGAWFIDVDPGTRGAEPLPNGGRVPGTVSRLRPPAVRLPARPERGSR